ncbi:hypothetical protein ACE1CI_17980 [Aerosakkonemataceae cyanobacterium BLCC-F50]|uniref:Uncharacterized protein n=1 Tax=Floridaenema flaviceps BLCC-F50 TaxID=3153642 RepID=A0ABV4XSY4_9CYAN
MGRTTKNQHDRTVGKEKLRYIHKDTRKYWAIALAVRSYACASATLIV